MDLPEQTIRETYPYRMFVPRQKSISSSTPEARTPLSPPVALPVLEPGDVGYCLLASDARLVSMSRYFAELVGSPVSSLFGQTIREVLGRSNGITAPELLSEGKNISLNLNGRSLYWNVHKIAPGAALAGYYIGTLSKGEQLNELERQLLHKDRLAILGESAAMIAHETVGPLTAIANNAELLLTFAKHDDETEQCLMSIKEEAHRAATLLQNVLTFASDAPSAFRPLSILEVVQESVKLLNRQVNYRKMVCRIDNASGLVPVAGSFEHLLQLFCNLIKNAFDASEEGKEIVIRIVKGQFRNEQPAIEIAVVDRGEGMSPFQLEHAFDQFFSTKPSGNGTGLGLTIARRIVATHHGEIRLESSPGKGTTARVLLPVHNDRKSNERRYLTIKK